MIFSVFVIIIVMIMDSYEAQNHIMKVAKIIRTDRIVIFV